MATEPSTAKKPIYKRAWFWVLAVIVIAAIASAGGSSDKSSTDSKQAGSGSGGAQKASGGGGGSKQESGSCGTRATDDCTPTVSMGKTVRVDALEWTVRDVKTRAQIGDTSYGLGAKADGVFVVLKLRVHSDRDQSATLTDNVFQLETPDGAKYDPDSEGTTAAVGNGDQPFFLEDLGPDSDHTGKVVFDVPSSKLSGLKVRFNELGFGQTHAYVRLPSLSA